MISVIVPVYNVEEYLEECLESIQYQTYTDIEVILVNDGSTDSSKEICERFCQADSRFKKIKVKVQPEILGLKNPLANTSCLSIVMMLSIKTC